MDMKIQKFQWGKKFSDIIQAASVIENPSIMTASGWRVVNRKALQDKQNDKDVRQLRNNLKVIGETGITAPTVVSDITGFYKILRHPIQSYKTIKEGLRNIQLFSQSAKVTDLLDNSQYLTKDIETGALEGFKDSYKYYSSDKYIEHLKATGLSEKEARELQDLKLNNLLRTRINFNYTDPQSYGHNTININGDLVAELNPRVANTRDLSRETIWHEVAGHASSGNYRQKDVPIINKYTSLKNIYSNPWYRKISEHNSKLIPELKPVWKAFMKGDMKTFNRLATKEDLEILDRYENPKAFIEYLEDEQEAAARAISANIGDYVGIKSQWNLPQLERFFTSEGIKRLRDNVWSIGIGFGGAVIKHSDPLPYKKN